MKCSECPFLMKRENISLVSRIMGYTAECSKTGILFTLEDINGSPDWCPLRDEKSDKWDL